MYYVGLDAHWKQSVFCVLDEHGRKIQTRTIKGPWSEVVGELSKMRQPIAVCFEASTGYGALHERLRRLGLPPI